MLATAGFVLGHLAALIVIIAVCWAAGWLALRQMTFHDALEAAAFRTGTGFGILGTLLFLIGLARMLTFPIVSVIAALLLVVAIAIAIRGWRGRIRNSRVVIFATLAFVPSFVLALYPPTSFDATLYHLPYARLFAESNAVVFAPTLRYPVFPQLNDLLFAAAFLLYDDVTAHLVQLLAFGVTAAAIVSRTSKLGGSVASWLAFALWAGSPLGVYLAGTAYIDLGVAMFVTLAVLALERWRESRISSWLWLSGALAGMAAGSKYHGALIVVLMMPAVFALAGRRRIRSTLIFLSAAAVLASPFYLRNEIVTGNPMFPYFDRVFGGLEWHSRGDQRMIPANLEPLEMAALVARRTFASSEFLTFPLRVAYDDRALQGLPPISLWMPLIIPAAVLGAVRIPAVAPAVLIAIAYTAAAARLDPRFLIIVFPLYVVAAAVWAGKRLTTRWLRAPLILMLLAPGPGYGLFKIMQQGALPVTAEQRREYLASRIAVYPAIDALNRLCGSDYAVYALHQENAAYYAEGKFLGDHIGPARFRLIEPKLADPAGLERELRRLDVDYFLVGNSQAALLKAQPEFSSRFRTTLRTGGFEIFLTPGGTDCAATAAGGRE